MWGLYFLTDKNPKIATHVVNRAGIHRCLFVRMAAVTSLGHSGKCWKIPWAQREAQATLREEEETCFSPVFSTHCRALPSTQLPKPGSQKPEDLLIFLCSYYTYCPKGVGWFYHQILLQVNPLFYHGPRYSTSAVCSCPEDKGSKHSWVLSMYQAVCLAQGVQIGHGFMSSKIYPRGRDKQLRMLLRYLIRARLCVRCWGRGQMGDK